MPEPLLAMLVTRTFILDDADKLLLIRRVANDRHNPGLWEPAGGKVDKGEKVSAARDREIFDETGLYVKSVSPIFIIGERMVTMGRFGEIPLIPMFSVARVVSGKLKLKIDEHDASAWVSYLEMFSYRLTPEARTAAKQLKEYLWI